MNNRENLTSRIFGVFLILFNNRKFNKKKNLEKITLKNIKIGILEIFISK